MGGRVRSLPRDDGNYEEGSLIGRTTDVRRSTQNGEVRTLTNRLMAYGKRGNRPSANVLPKPSSFTVSEVVVKVAGAEGTRN